MRPTQDKELEKTREQIEQDTKAYLESGKKITVIPYGVVKEDKKKAKKYNLDIVATRIAKGEKLEAVAAEYGATLTTMRAGLRSHGYI